MVGAPTIRASASALLLAVTLVGCSSPKPAPAPIPVPVSRADTASAPANATTPTPGTPTRATDPSAAAPDARVPLGAASDLRDIVRDELPGYRAGTLVADGDALQREYTAADGAVLGIKVERYRNASGAADAADRIARGTYAASGSVAEVVGLRGWFGLDSSGTAGLTLRDNALVVTLRLRGRAGKAAAIEADLYEVASTIFD